MNRRLWMGALGLCLGGSLGVLNAQQPVWRSAQRQAPPPTVVRGAAGSTPSVWLDRPVGTARGRSAEPRPFPTAYHSASSLSTQSLARGVEPIATVPPPGAVIATSSSVRVPYTPTEEYVDAAGGDLFAIDRVGPMQQVSGVQRLPAPTSLPDGDWKKTIPNDPPGFGVMPTETIVSSEPLIVSETPPTQFYVKGEYLLWWIKPDKAPPLVTTGPPEDGPDAGKLGQPRTIVLMDGNLDRNSFSWARGAVGFFLDDCGSTAIELGGFFLGTRSTKFEADSSRYSVLARPFLDVVTGQQDVQLVAFTPDGLTGRIVVDAPSELWGGEINALCNWCCGCDWRVDTLVGVRVLNLRESLTITEYVQNPSVDPNGDPTLPPFNGTLVTVQDRFATRNTFYGGQVGLEGRWQRGRLTVDGRGKVGLGVTQQQLDISGFQKFPPGTQNVEQKPGGLYALNSNIGSYDRGRFSVVPEVGLTVGYYLTDYVRATVGYNFLYWSGVARPGEQIDTNIDPNRIPNFLPDRGQKPQNGQYPVPLPAVTFPESDFWAHGLTFGVEFRY